MFKSMLYIGLPVLYQALHVQFKYCRAVIEPNFRGCPLLFSNRNLGVTLSLVVNSNTINIIRVIAIVYN